MSVGGVRQEEGGGGAGAEGGGEVSIQTVFDHKSFLFLP